MASHTLRCRYCTLVRTYITPVIGAFLRAIATKELDLLNSVEVGYSVHRNPIENIFYSRLHFQGYNFVFHQSKSFDTFCVISSRLQVV